MEEPLKKAVSIIVRVAELNKIILFGSRANGMAKAHSNYDLLVLKKGILDKYEILKDDIYMIYNGVDKNGKVIYEKYR